MKINRIQLFNFSSYEGENDFDFRNDDEKNIILIGGKNGAGKTSLFTAIKIALYGPLAFGYVGTNSHYINKIKDLINSKAFQQNKVKSRVQISISLKIEREVKDYIITREWDYIDQKLNEKFYLQRDNTVLDDQEQSYFQNYLQSIVPPDLFDFFLFDGEEVSNIFSSSSYNTYVKNAVFTLCGMDIFEIIRKYTKGYISKRSKNDDDEDLYKNYELIKKDFHKFETQKENLEKDINSYKESYEQIEVQLSELEVAFKKAGGITEEERKVLEDKYKESESRKTEYSAKMKMFVEELMPFIILKDFTSDISSQLDFEEKAEIFDYIQNKLNKKDIDGVLKNYDSSNDKLSDHLMEMLLGKFKPMGYSDGRNIIFDLSRDETAHINGLISNVENFNIDGMIKTVKAKNEACDITAEINRTLRNAISEDEAVIFAEKKNNLKKSKEEISRNLYMAETDLDYLKRDLNNLEQQKERLYQKIRVSTQNKNVYKISSGVSNIMKTLLEKKTISMRKRLEELIVQNLKHIYRKDNLITHVEVTEEFQFNLYQDDEYDESDIIRLLKNIGNSEFLTAIGSQSINKLYETYNVDDISKLRKRLEASNSKKKISLYKRIDINRLSKGERQIFILSLYWAIIILSGQEIPFIIDTPYARIDASHRKEISEKFFPNISKQVIILSTDEEINKEYYRIIKPYIAKEYLLVNDTSQNRTTVENHYFFEV